MATRVKGRTQSGIKGVAKISEIQGLHGVRLVEVGGESRLELRAKLGLTREVFGRLVNVSVRAIAQIETTSTKVEKLQRNYIEVQRLCESLSEVVDPASLGIWFCTPCQAFGGSKPIDVIDRGEIDRLWEMYYRLRSGLPG